MMHATKGILTAKKLIEKLSPNIVEVLKAANQWKSPDFLLGDVSIVLWL